MNQDRQIVVAAMRWATANAKRLEIGAAKRRADLAYKADGNIWGPAYHAGMDAAARLTPARRVELSALRALSKVCATARAQQVDDASMVVDAVEVLRLT